MRQGPTFQSPPMADTLARADLLVSTSTRSTKPPQYVALGPQANALRSPRAPSTMTLLGRDLLDAKSAGLSLVARQSDVSQATSSDPPRHPLSGPRPARGLIAFSLLSSAAVVLPCSSPYGLSPSVSLSASRNGPASRRCFARSPSHAGSFTGKPQRRKVETGMSVPAEGIAPAHC